MKVKVTIDKTRKLLDAMRALRTQQVLVGVPEEDDERKQNNEGVGNAYIAWFNEHGGRAEIDGHVIMVPPRPFMQLGMKKAAPKIRKESKDAGVQTLDDPKKVNVALSRLGIIAQSGIKRQIQSGEGYAPLSPVTIRMRQERRTSGKAGTTPLLDTGQLLNSIHYVIRKRKSRGAS